MLVLTRLAEQSVIALCGGTPPLRVVFKVLEIEHNRVRVGIEAPPEVTLLRDEVERRQAGTE